jgi:hypothetical protein
MDTEESLLFSELLFAYKHLWIKHQEFKYLVNHPGADSEAIHERFSEEADDLFRPLETALLERQPLQDALRAIVRTVSQAHVH